MFKTGDATGSFSLMLAPDALQPAGIPLFGEGLENQFVFVDLVQRNRERLVIDGGIDERADIVEEASLVQVCVVVVDLAGTLGREDDQRVLGVDLREQLVDGRVNDAL